MWFANPTTLYVADEGAGDNTYDPSTGQYTAAAASAAAGLQKWVFDPSSHQWSLTYTLQSGLNLGVPYTVPGYPTGMNNGQATPGDGTGLPWAPATAGLRNITGEVNRNGTATIWAETSTVSGSGDQGADPNELVSITDNMAATGTSPPANESFQTVVPPTNGVVVRGVSFAPGTGIPAAGNVTCSGITNSDTTISGNVTVPSGASCTLVDTTVDGNVQVQNGGSLLDTDSTIDGNLETNNADWVDVPAAASTATFRSRERQGCPTSATPRRPMTCAARPSAETCRCKATAPAHRSTSVERRTAPRRSRSVATCRCKTMPGVDHRPGSGWKRPRRHSAGQHPGQKQHRWRFADGQLCWWELPARR